MVGGATWTGVLISVVVASWRLDCEGRCSSLRLVPPSWLGTVWLGMELVERRSARGENSIIGGEGFGRDGISFGDFFGGCDYEVDRSDQMYEKQQGEVCVKRSYSYVSKITSFFHNTFP